jgi:hypothetical protein
MKPWKLHTWIGFSWLHLGCGDWVLKWTFLSRLDVSCNTSMLSEQGTCRCLNQYIIGGENNIQKMCWLNEMVCNSQLDWFVWIFYLVTTYIYRPLTMSVYLMKSDVVGTSMSRAMM